MYPRTRELPPNHREALWADGPRVVPTELGADSTASDLQVPQEFFIFICDRCVGWHIFAKEVYMDISTEGA